MKRFTVIDGANAYYLLDNITQLEVCCGDGVDVFLDEMYDEFAGVESFPEVGTEAFRAAWERDANEDVDVYFGAFFPRLDSLVIYDNDGETIDRYTVLVERASPLECHLQKEENLWVCLGLSSNCDSPQGYALWGLAVPNERLGGKVHFLELPDNVQKHIAERLEEGRDDTDVVSNGV